MFNAVVDILKAALRKKDTCISAFFLKLYLVMASTLFISKNYHFSIWDFCLNCLKAFLRRWEKPWVSATRKPWSMLATGELCFNQLMCISMSTKLCIVKDVSVVPLTLFLEGLLVPGQIRIYTHYLGGHTCLVKPMRFIQLKIQMGNDQGIKFWPWRCDLQRVALCGLFWQRPV